MLALPLTAVLVLHASAEGMSLLSAVGMLPSLLLSVHLGAWVDRRGHRRTTMLAADAARFALLVLVPSAYLLGILSLPLLIAVALLLGTCSVLFRVSAGTLFVSLVPKDRYVEASSLLAGSRATAFFVGPGIGGYLIAVLGAPFALLADAVSFAASAVSLAAIRPQEPPPAAHGPGETLAGLRFLRGSPVLRQYVGATATISLCQSVTLALYILYATRYLHVTPFEWGIILGPSSLGAILASGLAGRLGRRIGLGRTLLVGVLLYTVPYLLIPLAGGAHLLVVATLFLAEGLAAAGSMIREVASGTIQAAAIPDELRARAMAGFVAVSSGIRPFGALAAGLLAGILGIHLTLWLATAGAALAFLWLLPLPLRSLRTVQDFAPHASGTLEV